MADIPDDQVPPEFDLPLATGGYLDAWGQHLDFPRNDAEPDEDYRARLMVFIDSRRAPKDREWAR